MSAPVWASHRLDLAAVEASLRQVQARLPVHRDPLDDRVVDNMLAGYAFVDALVAAGTDIFALGQLKHLLELNTLVLCGASEARRAAHAGHRAATERRFYDEPDAGIQDVVEWHAGHDDEPVWSRAAGVYVRMLTTPQLFIEGNHRTGVLVMSYVLLNAGRAPFVLSVGNAEAYFEVSAALRHTHKNGPLALFRLPRLRRRLAALLRDHDDGRYLLA